jgi:uncharacterized protein YjiS (DUF1127 family)
MQASDGDDDLWTTTAGRRLTPGEWERFKRLAIARARAARGQEARALAGAAIAALRAAAGSGRDAIRAHAGRAVAAVTLWWERRQAVLELSRLDDRSLRDIGLNRAEIEFVIYETVRPPVRKLSVPHPRRSRARSKASRPGAKPMINKAAA